MTRRDFRTPSAVPEGYITRCITIPANQEWLGLVNAALLMLTEPWRYTQVFDTDLSPAETAAIAFDMYVDYLAGCEVDMNCADILACVLPLFQGESVASGTVRLDPVTDEPQVSYDGGTTWTDLTPTSGGPTTPTLTPTSGGNDDTKKCLAATRAMLVISQFYQQTFGAVAADITNTLNGINQFLWQVNTTLYNAIYSPYEGVLEAAGWFDFDFETNFTAAALDSTAQEALLCLLLDSASVDVDGVVTFDYGAVFDNTITELGINPGTAVTLLLSNMQQAGLNAASNVAVTDVGDCEACLDGCSHEVGFDPGDTFDILHGALSGSTGNPLPSIAATQYTDGCTSGYCQRVSVSIPFATCVVSNVAAQFRSTGLIRWWVRVYAGATLLEEQTALITPPSGSFGTFSRNFADLTADRVEITASVGYASNFGQFIYLDNVAVT